MPTLPRPCAAEAACRPGRQQGRSSRPRTAVARLAALPSSGDASGVDGGGDLDVGLFVTTTATKSGGGGSAGSPGPAPPALTAAPPPPPPPPPPPTGPPGQPLPQELVDAGVTAIHTNLPIPGATRAGPGKVSSTPAGAYAHSAMAEGGAGFWHRATNNAAAAPRAFYDRLAEGYAWRNKPVRAGGGEAKPSFVAVVSKPAAAGRKGFGSGAAPRPPPPAGPARGPAWFAGGTTSLAWNAVGRHVEAGQGARTALSGGGRGLTFEAAAGEAAALGAWLAGPGGVRPGDAVAVVLPAGPAAGVAALGVAHAGGAVLSLDPGASTDALAAALAGSRPRLVVTASGGPMAAGGPPAPIKARVDAALQAAASSSDPSYAPPDTVLVYEMDVSIADTPWSCGRDVWAHAALPEGGRGPGGAPAWVAAASPALLLPSPSCVFVHPAAGYMVGAGATARLGWDVRAGDGVAVAAPPGHPAWALGLWGALLNCGTAVLLPPPLSAGPADAVASSAAAWLRAVAAAGATHVVAGDGATARALAAGAAADPAAAAAAVAAGLRLATLCGPDPGEGALSAWAASFPPSLAMTAAWLPAGAGTPPMAGVPGPAAPMRAGGLRPFLRGAGDWTTAWPAAASASLPADAWSSALLDGSGRFAAGVVEGRWDAVDEGGEVVFVK